MRLPVISACLVRECSYNADATCHAGAITVGNAAHPRCDTYVQSSTHCDSNAPVAAVGACKVTDCRHNRRLECHAHAIRVGYHGVHADCLTFARA
ncbi:MAG: DUF1540 domain-containing protein [Polyangiaceae bacterium]|nr:DUF1540 domain-containing protein [Polyangiaceae bacterium]